MWIKLAIVALIPLGLILNVICWRKRSLCHLIIYYENLSTFVQGFVPTNQGDYGSLVLMMYTVFVFFCYGTNFKKQAIATALAQLLVDFIPIRIV